MGLGMKKHPQRTHPAPDLNWMNAAAQAGRDRLRSLQSEVRSGAITLARSNAALIAAETARLVREIRTTCWPAAALICATILRLIQIQMEVERLILRNRQEGGLGARRR